MSIQVDDKVGSNVSFTHIGNDFLLIDIQIDDTYEAYNNQSMQVLQYLCGSSVGVNHTVSRKHVNRFTPLCMVFVWISYFLTIYETFLKYVLNLSNNLQVLPNSSNCDINF